MVSGTFPGDYADMTCAGRAEGRPDADQPLTIHVYSDAEHFVTAYTRDLGISPAQARAQLAAGQFAFATPGGHIWLYLVNFQAKNVPTRRVALFHEYTHTLQQWQADIRFQSSAPEERSFVPRWIVDGCAEYLAAEAAGRRHPVDEGRARASFVAQVKTSTEPLQGLETAGEASFRGSSGEAYTVGWLGCEHLSQIRGEDGVAHAFWLSSARRRDWNAAFADVFGETPASSYADFAAFRTTL